MAAGDRELGMGASITRRDFLDGVRVATGLALLPACRRGEPDRELGPEQLPDYYPPARTGLRGSHPGSFEIAHQLRDGTLGATVAAPVDTHERYDLVVVGAGLSGLAAAHFFRAARGDAATVLVLDNHDDVGGHAKRNELAVGGRTLMSAGGTAAIEYPAQYSKVAHRLLADLGVDLPRVLARFARPPRAELGDATFFDRETFGTDRLVHGSGEAADLDDFLARAPLTDAARRDLARLWRDRDDPWPTLAADAKKHRLAKTSYLRYLLDVAGVTPELVPLLQTRTHDLYGVGIDAVSALDCWGLGLPGFDRLALDRAPTAELGRTPQLEMHDGPRWFAFPDGNASLVRLLVRALVPAALPGTSMDDVVTARLAYARLDDPAAPVRMRLNATVVRAREQRGAVEVTYVRGGRARVVRAGACVLACWNGIIPYLCPELPEAQRRALGYGVKVPIIYANVAIRDWRAFARLGVAEIAAPGGYFISAQLERDRVHDRPDEPAVVKLVRTPCAPGLPARDQHRRGRMALMTTSFEVFERALRDQLARMLAGGGFDPARDIAAIAVNRWAHGYSYEYNSLWDDAWPPGQEPCTIGRRQFGRIAIANADAGAYAYTDGAIDQAWRAISELVG